MHAPCTRAPPPITLLVSPSHALPHTPSFTIITHTYTSVSPILQSSFSLSPLSLQPFQITLLDFLPPLYISRSPTSAQVAPGSLFCAPPLNPHLAVAINSSSTGITLPTRSTTGSFPELMAEYPEMLSQLAAPVGPPCMLPQPDSPSYCPLPYYFPVLPLRLCFVSFPAHSSPPMFPQVPCLFLVAHPQAVVPLSLIHI